jgi:regulator of sirC expression with transglutaminase-like and TPR domain
MDARVDLALFAHVARRPEHEIDLARAAILIAEPDYPGLDVARTVDELDRLGALARRRLDLPDAAERDPQLSVVLHLLHDELGFRGNADDYYDPRNSFLNEVLKRRVGIPISLAVVAMEVAARAGVEARGVSFPGHFLLRAAAGRGIALFDPFDGKRLDLRALRLLTLRATGEERDPDPRLLEPATKTQILVRMLNNLRNIYEARGDSERLDAALARIALLEGRTWSKSTPTN